ncbi:hypothetical protein P3W45_000191 [Vairimorpha bombi]|jgi:histidyl-tRNA synthetase
MDCKPPKGTVDCSPPDAILYDTLIQNTKSIFQLHGAVPIDTPVFELKSILLNKYGEDTKLIYDLKETGGEACALRYDLTVPFSRYMSMSKLKKIKRYQIGKVYRRDQPSIKQGRLREFLQADFDIAGDGLTPMIDSELISCVHRLLNLYDIGDFCIRISDRRLLFAIFRISNIPELLYHTVSSTIDKMDKLSLEDINDELVSKGLDESHTNILNKYIKLIGKLDLLDFLKDDPVYEICKDAVDELIKIFEYCNLMKCSDKLILDLSLARGLDYYTGLILEGRYLNKDVGSVVGGGRYDNLIGNLNNKNTTRSTKDSVISEKINSKNKVPCAGFSIGLSRIFSLLKDKQIVECFTDVFLTGSGKLFLEERLALQSRLWDEGIRVETFYTKRCNVTDHKRYCVKKGIKYLVVVGEQEYQEGNVNIVNVITDTKEKVEIDRLGRYIKSNKPFDN